VWLTGAETTFSHLLILKFASRKRAFYQFPAGNCTFAAFTARAAAAENNESKKFIEVQMACVSSEMNACRT
jgi:hypothetical protein